MKLFSIWDSGKEKLSFKHISVLFGVVEPFVHFSRKNYEEYFY